MRVTPISELNDRARDIFRLVVENYLGNGAPVGSRTISQLPGLNLSSASIRNVMQDLEEMGLLAAPHVSAGRVPTESGLRLFVDGMMQMAEPSPEERRVIEQGLGEGGGPIENALASASAVLSGLSACAGMVLVPRRETVLRQFSFVPLEQGGPGRGEQALAVLVGADGSVENRIVDLPPGTNSSALIEAGNFISARLSGLTLAQAREKLGEELAQDRAALDEAARGLVERGLASWSSDAAERPVLIVRGQANLIDEHASADLERVRQLLEELEGKQEISRLMEGAMQAAATKIFIGSENKLFSLSGSSVIAAPYRDGEGRVVGVVGVIGPTRLNYARVIPMVDFTAQTLSRLMR
ncbi:heat-inducible transcriptional repressor HrcA [Sphingobium sp. DEHP117]|uniref:heat-inducible transcriptional repressor HrcA n=1 Tax=Sphingobium sp. DEHP117 TaxID=2993436 RepID=UPI0027D63D52|nr:heat-inducible transcriptional repressor HrcA [Sphingobium sp. DEHP117]MDQ4418873.1 heat-inducible transcriptional repressor HrcA [Sphingobium sp. DEHP117]